tara:strand:+ start:398 stop:997 length:600 start_codon:yes stop_codon:yes gene_type:complete
MDFWIPIMKNFFIIFLFVMFTGCVSLSYQKAQDAFHRGDYVEAVKGFKLLAEQGDPRGQYGLAIMYDLGEGVPQSSKKALEYYRVAAEQGFADAQNNLGVMYDLGEGVEKNYKEALKWYKLAAENGNRDAPNNIGVLYMTGLGTPRDFVMAHKWFTVAGARDIEAKNNKKFVEKGLTTEQIEESKQFAEEWKKKVMKIQ